MESLKQTQKKYAVRTLTLAIVIALFFILMGQKPVAKGFIMGAFFSVINFILIGKTITLRFGRSKRKTFSISMGSIILRYLLLAIPLIAALKFEQLNLVAAILGIFMIQFVILAEHLLTLFPSWRNKQT
jgi:hypothetical protein